MFHFNTKSYANHKSLDKYLDNFLKLFDKLIEAIKGKYNIDTQKEFSINFNPNTSLENHLECFSILIGKLIENFDASEINVIHDDILLGIDQLVYLLRLK